ncbi:MAG: c-type cytochrome [Epsilonproteobacteria bacterium]|nr:c-type cytochrome [Campylobacterota bacterium]
MKELKILAVVVFFTLVTYWGVEPYAHGQMHKHVESENFAYKDLPAIDKTGDATRGSELVMGAAACIGCHGIESQGMPAPMDAVTAAASYGVNPPDLSNIGALYDDKFLAALIKNPAHATKSEHVYSDTKPHPMTSFYGAGGDMDQEIADMVAYFKSIAPKEISNKQAFVDACGRCHAMRYDKWTQIGSVPKTKSNIKTGQDLELLAFKTQVGQYQNALADYMGKLPPDLSMTIRAKSHEFLETFIENPQSQLPGTAMPRVGLTKEGTAKVMAYMTEVGDPSKPARDSLGWKVILFFVIFTLLAYFWKKSVWRKLH